MFINLILFLVFIIITESAKILVVVPTPSISHQVVYRPLIQELMNRDHDVTAIVTDPVFPQGTPPNNLNEINFHDMAYKLWKRMLSENPINEQASLLTLIKISTHALSIIFEQLLKDKSVQKLIRTMTTKFDLLILQPSVPPTLIFSYIFKAPVILMNPYGAMPGNMQSIGTVTHPLLYPTHYHRRIYNLTFWEKISELYNHEAFEKMIEQQEIQDDIMLRNLFGEDTPPLRELKHNVHMLFLNVHSIWLDNQPVPASVVHTWGIHRPPKQILPNDLQLYLDSSKNGFIYVSFGTNFKTSNISPEKLKIFVKVFSQLPYNILWKWDMDELPGKSENVKIFKWCPQSDVLSHPNLKIFITQGGLQSTSEAINAGVPLIGIPMVADQAYNTEKYNYFQIGIKLDFETFSVESFGNAINTIFTDYNSYKKNVIRLRTLLSDQPTPPLEHAILWIEYVLRHSGVQHLTSAAANMSWTEYYEVELVLLTFSAVIVFLVTLGYCILHMLGLINKLRLPSNLSQKLIVRKRFV